MGIHLYEVDGYIGSSYSACIFLILIYICILSRVAVLSSSEIQRYDADGYIGSSFRSCIFFSDIDMYSDTQ